jgi:hypothetical protein
MLLDIPRYIPAWDDQTYSSPSGSLTLPM